MNNKGFTETSINLETPNEINHTEKPLKTQLKKQKRVDINILKSKLHETEAKEFRKNLTIFISFLILIGSLGIYLSI